MSQSIAQFITSNLNTASFICAAHKFLCATLHPTTMEYSIAEKVHVTAWIISGITINESIEKFETEFQKRAPPKSTLHDWKKKLLETGNLSSDRPRSGRPRTVTTEENKENVVTAVRDDPTTSIRRLSSDLGISRPSVQRILKENKFHPYKPYYSQFLCDGDSDRRSEFCEQMIAKMEYDPAFLRKLTFSDEATFSLNGSVNKHNVHYCMVWRQSEGEDPQSRKDRNTLRLGLHRLPRSFGIRHGSTHDDRSQIQWHFKGENCAILQKTPPVLLPTRRCQCPLCPAGEETLNSELPGRWIGRRGAIEWPARSPDLTPCDYWLWSYLRSKVYTLGEIFPTITGTSLRNKIENELNAIPLDMFGRVFRDFINRCESCVDHQGELFEE